jgi:5-methylcytosine-specific restriction endonuclease McrA
MSLLDGSVLVLNRSWVAVHVADVRRALGLVYRDVARVVSPEDFSTYDFDDWKEMSVAANDRCINATNFRIMVPEVIVLRYFNEFIRKEVRFSRRNIFERDHNVCQYCGKRFAKPDLTIDHVIPRSCGGCDSWTNLVLACVRCNVKKGSKTPEEACMKLVRPPRKPSWMPHLGIRFSVSSRDSWQKFVDTAYWNAELQE